MSFATNNISEASGAAILSVTDVETKIAEVINTRLTLGFCLQSQRFFQ